MIPETAQLSLSLALIWSALLGFLGLWGAHRASAIVLKLVRPLTFGIFAAVSYAFAVLILAFVQQDYSVAYVTANANSLLPVYFRVAATWGGHEGSLLLWVLMQAGWMLAVAIFSRQLPIVTVARVLGVLGWIVFGFLAFMLFTSNPFERILPAPPDGRDLNPLLQDWGMIFHPPLLYMGYVGFSVAFAFAIAALIEGRLDAAWAKWTRPWTLSAWAFLTLGILLGSFWAYYELGWGGWWFWDAVENASFMPWLVGTALLHSLIVSEKRGSFKNWTVLLAILTFSLSLLGTFLVRSGVLTSVHAFASDPERGSFILAFLTVVVGGSLALFAWRAPQVGIGGKFALFSRESLLLVNNLFLLVTTATILLGTLYPLAVDALGMGKISVGPPYFETVFVPLMLPVLLLIGIGPYLTWKQSSVGVVVQALRGPVVLTVFPVAMALFSGRSWLFVTGVALSGWIVLTTLQHAWRHWRGNGSAIPFRQRWRQVTAAFWGMTVSHMGVGVFVFGVTLVQGLGQSKEASMAVGDAVELGAYTFKIEHVERVNGPNFVAARARFGVYQDGQQVSLLHPEKRFYVVQQMPMTEAAIDRSWNQDLYVSIGEAAPDGRWGVRIQIKPYMSWVWSGVLLMGVGGFMAAGDKRYRQGKRTASALQSAPDVALGSASTSVQL